LQLYAYQNCEILKSETEPVILVDLSIGAWSSPWLRKFAQSVLMPWSICALTASDAASHAPHGHVSQACPWIAPIPLFFNAPEVLVDTLLQLL
jgi:hypothetical protein